MGLGLMLPKFKLANRPNALLKVRLKPRDCQSEPNGEKTAHAWLLPKGQLHTSLKHTFCMFLLFAVGEGVVECEVVSELLVIIFYLHSLWLSLSRSLPSGIFFLPLFALKAPPYRNAGFRFLSEQEALACPDSVAMEMGMETMFGGDIKEPHPPPTNLFDLLVQPHSFFFLINF